MRRSDVRFKEKTDNALFDPGTSVLGDVELVGQTEPVVITPDVAIIPNGWEALPQVGPDFPYDGQPVWLTSTGKDAHPATWRTTRAYDAINVKWVHEAYWARHNAGGQRIDFEPLGYKKMED